MDPYTGAWQNRQHGVLKVVHLTDALLPTKVKKVEEVTAVHPGGNVNLQVRTFNESISLSSSKSYMRGETGYVKGVNFVRK